jgi:hypothetical protein
MDWITFRASVFDLVLLIPPALFLSFVGRVARASRLPATKTVILVAVVAGAIWGYATAVGYIPMFLNTASLHAVRALDLTERLEWSKAMTAVTGSVWAAIGLAVSSRGVWGAPRTQ